MKIKYKQAKNMEAVKIVGGLENEKELMEFAGDDITLLGMPFQAIALKSNRSNALGSIGDYIVKDERTNPTLYTEAEFNALFEEIK